MSEPGSALAVVGEVNRRFAAGEDPFALFSEQIVWQIPMFDREDVFHGHRGVAEFFRLWLGTWEGYRFELEDTLEAPDGRVVTLFSEQGRGRTSGAPVHLRGAGIWTVADGLVTHYRGYADREEGLRAGGLA